MNDKTYTVNLTEREIEMICNCLYLRHTEYIVMCAKGEGDRETNKHIAKKYKELAKNIRNQANQ